MANLCNIGDKEGILQIPDDSMSILVFEVVDVFEVGPNETYSEIVMWPLAYNLEFGERLDGIYGEGGVG